MKSLMKQLADVKKANFALMEAQRALQNKVEDLAHVSYNNKINQIPHFYSAIFRVL